MLKKHSSAGGTTGNRPKIDSTRGEHFALPNPELIKHLRAPSMLLQGESGAGKTYSISSLLDTGITPFVLFVDPGMETIAEFAGDPDDCKIHWKYIAPAGESWETLLDGALKVNTLSHKQLTEMPDVNKSSHQQIVECIAALANFKCDRCGQHFGPVDAWGHDRALFIDNLTGLSDMAMASVVGSKPVRSQANWGVAQNVLEFILKKVVMDTYCYTVIIAHQDREPNEVTGGIQVMASTLGKKLAPKLPRMFSDVVQAFFDGDNWKWSTKSGSAFLKARNLPMAENLSPSHAQVIEIWQSRGGKIIDTLTEAPVVLTNELPNESQVG